MSNFMRHLSKPVLLKLYFLMGALESMFALYLIMTIPSDVKNIVFLGYSLRRLLLLGGVFVLSSLFSIFFVWIIVSAKVLNQAIFSTENIFKTPFRYFPLNGLSATLLILGLVLLLTPDNNLKGTTSFVERLTPVIYLGSAIGAQTLIGQFLWRDQQLNWSVFFEWKKLFVVTGLLVGVLLAFSVWVSWTGLGLIPERNGWLPPGTPIIFSQLFLVWLLGLPFILWGAAIEKRIATFQQKFPFHIRLDMIICLALWLAAFLMWWGEPMRKESYFTMHPEPPNFSYYPFSDAALYDLSAQNILIGTDQNNKIILRPLYVIFLVFLHMIGGQQYMHVIFMQILVLASIPALAYLITSILGGRAAGLLTAFLLILREKNAIALTNVIEVSHSKLMMSDVPTMALMLLMVYVYIKWLKSPSTPHYFGIVAGSSFGLLMLMRSSQALFIIPAVFLGMVFSGGFQLNRTVLRIMLFIFGFAVVTAPWIWRNYEVNSKLEIESSEIYIGWYAGAYTEPTDTIAVLPGESAEDYSTRIKRQIFQYVLHHPVELARVYTTYFIRNEIDSVIYLPMSINLYDLRSYVSQMRFWSEPVVVFTIGSGLIFFATLGLIILGICKSVQRLGFLGLMPLLFHFTYNFSMSIARISGWRFVLPVEWVFQLYYCIGLVVLTIVAISLFSKELSTVINNMQDENGDGGFPIAGIRTQQLLLVFFFFVGISLPLTVMLIPEKYPNDDAARMIAQYKANGILLNKGERINAMNVRSFFETEAPAVFLYGRALYPLFYKQGDFSGDNNPFSIMVQNLDRMQFTFIGAENAVVFIQMDMPPQDFPNASDVFIIGCRENGGVRALAIKLNEGDSFITTTPWQGLTCQTE